MIASQHWSLSYEKFMMQFDHHVADDYPSAASLTQEMADQWCAVRPTETINSNLARTNVVIALIRYMHGRGLTNVTEPDRAKPQKCTHIPHAFTEEELTRFFYECDHIKAAGGRKDSLIRKLILCVIFRLMYCTGIRPNEARELKRDEVDLEHGVLNIRHTKGHNQHYTAIHESLISTLQEYDRRMEALMPGRVYFFPNGSNGFYSKKWLGRWFSKLWNRANPHSSKAVSYDFRHHYATTNINSWTGSSFDSYSKLYYLSKSMGHCSVEHTMYYYSIVPQMADILLEKTNDDFDELVPEVEDEDYW